MNSLICMCVGVFFVLFFKVFGTEDMEPLLYGLVSTQFAASLVMFSELDQIKKRKK
jgi:amino acid permease